MSLQSGNDVHIPVTLQGKTISDIQATISLKNRRFLEQKGDEIDVCRYPEAQNGTVLSVGNVWKKRNTLRDFFFSRFTGIIQCPMSLYHLLHHPSTMPSPPPPGKYPGKDPNLFDFPVSNRFFHANGNRPLLGCYCTVLFGGKLSRPVFSYKRKRSIYVVKSVLFLLLTCKPGIIIYLGTKLHNIPVYN